MKIHANDCTLFVARESISIEDNRGEIVCWHRLDWIEDPTLADKIVSMLQLAHDDGAGAVRARMGI
jgi:hypothetical protein